MWRRRPVPYTDRENGGGDINASNSASASAEPSSSYTSLPLSTIPERDSLVSHRLSDVPTASSVYTNGSPDLPFGFDNPNAPPPLFSTAPDSSTPSAPHDQPSSIPRSNIPVPRKAVAPKVTTQTSNMKTTLGKPFSERAARAGFSGLSIDIQPRGAWKGASGRIPILESIRSAPVSEGSSSGATPMVSTMQDTKRGSISAVTQSHNANATTFPLRSGSPDAYAFAFVADSFDKEDEDLKPTVPLKTGTNSPFRMSSPASRTIQANKSPSISPVTASGPPTPTTYVSAVSEELYRPAPPNASLAESAGRDSTSSSRQPALIAQDIVQTPVHLTFPVNDGSLGRPSLDTTRSFDTGDDDQLMPTSKQPQMSRFSWTTQATESPPRNIYPSPESTRNQSSPPPPIIMRKRPISGLTTGSLVKRKPTPSQINATQILGTKLPPTAKVLMSKELPLSPPELESIDHVTALQAQIDDLGHRRRNLQKVIQNLTQLQPQNPVIQDLTARRETARKVAQFRSQLSEVQREEYDLGIRLCRAWKRRDQQPPTTLWVRRVTT